MRDKDVTVSQYNFIAENVKKFRLSEQIIVYDSTLRDGEQMPGVSFSPEQKICIAKKLDEIGVPEIEAGFPAISKTELNTVKSIVSEGLNANILVLSRLKKEDIDAAVSCDADVVLLFIASSPIHLKYKLHLSEDEIKRKMVDSIEYARDHGIIPSFSTEDSTRTPLLFLKKLVRIAQNVGAKRIGFTDTVGCATPQTIEYLFSQMKKYIDTPLSAHLHNDFGLALPNALAALHAGATHICTTINGWGERAGNVSLEQLVVTLKHLYNRDVGIKTDGFYELSQMVSDFVNVRVSPNLPFVGENVFTHESGIHTAAVLSNPFTYESLRPETVGNKRRLVLGKHSGHHFIDHKLQEMNIVPSKEEKQKIALEVKLLGEEKGIVNEDDFLQIVQRTIRS